MNDSHSIDNPSDSDVAHLATKVSVKEIHRTTSFHFWVSSYPFFETSFFITPAALIAGGSREGSGGEGKGEESCTVRIELRDADGIIINKVVITFPAQEIFILEMEPLLGTCKLESGIKHAHAIITVDEGSSVVCRVHTKDSAVIVGEPRIVTTTTASFIPITLGAGRQNLFLIINRSECEVVCRARLFFAKRSPEATWALPPLGSRVVLLEADFAPYISLDKEEQLQAYLRISTKSGDVGIQTLERTDGVKEEAYFSSMS